MAAGYKVFCGWSGSSMLRELERDSKVWFIWEEIADVGGRDSGEAAPGERIDQARFRDLRGEEPNEKEEKKI